MSWQPVQPGLEHPGSRLEGRGKAGTWWLEMELFPEGGGKGETGKGQEWAWAKPHPLTIAGATSRCTLGPGCTRSRKTGRTCGWVKRGPVVGGALTPDPGPVPSPPPPPAPRPLSQSQHCPHSLWGGDKDGAEQGPRTTPLPLLTCTSNPFPNITALEGG